jgi:hypothetical protein
LLLGGRRRAADEILRHAAFAAPVGLEDWSLRYKQRALAPERA